MRRTFILVLILSLMITSFTLVGCENNNQQTSEGKIEFKEFTSDDVVFENNELFIKNQLLITADKKLSYSDVEKAVGNYGGKIVGCIEFTNDYQVEFENSNYSKLTEIMSDLSNDLPDSDITLHNAYTIDSASKDYKESYTNDYSTNDGNWWRQSIQLTDLESKNYEYQTVKVGLIDTLFDTRNPDLSEYFAGDGVLYNDENKLAEEADSLHGNHGTNVTGFLAAKKGNGIGIDGVANNVELYGYAISGNAKKKNTFSSQKSSSMHNKYQIARLLSKGVKIINISLGSEEGLAAATLNIRQARKDVNTYSESMETFLKKYIDHGQQFVIIKSAGNENGETYIYCKEGITKAHPYGIKCYNSKTDGNLSDYEKCSFTATADLDEFGAIEVPEVKNRIIIVGSSTKENNRAAHSVCGERIDIYAPGEQLTELTTGGNNGIGTSYATPIVSGVAALIWGMNPEISADSIKFIIKSQATKPIINEMGKTDSYKFLVNANNAVEFARTFKKTITLKSGENNGKLLGYVRKTNDNHEVEELGESCDVSIFKGNEQEAYAALNESDHQEPVAYTHLTTDINGEFDLDLPEGDYYLFAKYNNGEYESVIKTFKIVKGEVCYLDDIILSKNIKNQSTNTTNDDSYHNTQYGWSVDIPAEWNQYGIIKESDNDYSFSVLFYHKELNEKYSNGFVMSIEAIPKSKGKQQPPGLSGYLGENNNYYFYWIKASDVQWMASGHHTEKDIDSEDQRHRDEYKVLEKAADTIRSSFKVDDPITSIENNNPPSEIMEIKRNETYTFSGTLIKDTESMEGVVFHFLILDSPIRCRIYYSSNTSEEKDIDSIQITTGSVVNIDDYVNMRITVTGRTPFGPARAGTPDVKDIKLCADNIQVK